MDVQRLCSSCAEPLLGWPCHGSQHCMLGFELSMYMTAMNLCLRYQ
jgi:hypothetical protein